MSLGNSPNGRGTYVNQMFAAADTWVLSRKFYEFVVPYWEQVAVGTAPDIGAPDSAARDEFAQDPHRSDQGGLLQCPDRRPGNETCGALRRLVAHLRELTGQDGPAVITAGPRLFEHTTRDLGFRLIDSRIFDSGAAVVRYRTLDAAEEK